MLQRKENRANEKCFSVKISITRPQLTANRKLAFGTVVMATTNISENFSLFQKINEYTLFWPKLFFNHCYHENLHCRFDS
jgi:hypothetical protein